MNGPQSEAEVRQAHAELVRMLTSHKARCFNCNTGRVCLMARTYDRSIAAAVTLAETAKVVDGNDA